VHLLYVSEKNFTNRLEFFVVVVVVVCKLEYFLITMRKRVNDFYLIRMRPGLYENEPNHVSTSTVLCTCDIHVTYWKTRSVQRCLVIRICNITTKLLIAVEELLN